jgi:hypothetical protein
MDIKKGDKCLVTTNEWFFAPDGKQYRAVFGTVIGIHETVSVLGVKANARSANWFMEVGCMVIAGCQIHYLIKTSAANLGDVKDASWGKEGCEEFTRPSAIFNADQRN